MQNPCASTVTCKKGCSLPMHFSRGEAALGPAAVAVAAASHWSSSLLLRRFDAGSVQGGLPRACARAPLQDGTP